MKRIVLVLGLALLVAAPTARVWAASPQTADAQQKSLYQRLGGYDALAAVTDDFLTRLEGDPQLKRFFIGFSTDSQTRIRGHVIDFLCQVTGGPCSYTGRDMKTAHTGLHITDDDWQSAVKHLTATLDKFKVPDKEKGEVLSAISGLKDQIVGL
jgi:hemoglobin